MREKGRCCRFLLTDIERRIYHKQNLVNTKAMSYTVSDYFNFKRAQYIDLMAIVCPHVVCVATP